MIGPLRLISALSALAALAGSTSLPARAEPTSAPAAQKTRSLTDHDFRQRYAPGPRPLFYFSNGRYWPSHGPHACKTLVGAGYWAPTFVVYDDRTVFFVPPAKNNAVARFHRLRLRRGEFAELKKELAALPFSQWKPYYDLAPGSHHASTNLLVSWLSGRRRSVAIRGGSGLGLGFISGRRQRRAPRLPRRLAELQLRFSRYAHARARPWAPKFRLSLREDARFLLFGSSSRAKAKPWPKRWPRPRVEKIAVGPGQKLSLMTARLPGRRLGRAIALLGVERGCFNAGTRLTLDGKNWRAGIDLPAFPQQRLWLDEQASLPEIVGWLQSNDRETRVRGLSRLERAISWGVEPLLRLLQHRSPRVRALTALALGQSLKLPYGSFFGAKVDAQRTRVHFPLEALRRDPAELVRTHAAIALWRVGRRSGESMKLIIGGLSSKTTPVRRLAAHALHELSKSKKIGSAVLALRNALTDRDLEVRIFAALALNQQSGEVARSTPVLVAALRAAGDEERMQIVERLGQIGHKHPAAWPAVIGALQDRYYHTRGKAVQALEKDKASAHVAIPLLHRILLIDTGYVRSSAKQLLFALGQRGPVLATLLRALQSKNADVRSWTTDDIGDYKKDAAVAVRALLHLLETDPNGPNRAAAAMALAKIGDRSKAVLDALRAATKSTHSGASSCATEALRKLTAPPKRSRLLPRHAPR